MPWAYYLIFICLHSSINNIMSLIYILCSGIGCNTYKILLGPIILTQVKIFNTIYACII